MPRQTIDVNGGKVAVIAPPDTPLLYVLRDRLGLAGPRFGCGLGACGAGTGLLGDQARRSCVTPVAAVGGRRLTTVEGLGTPEKPHPLQSAFIEEQAAQRGFCPSGMLMAPAAFLKLELLPANPRRDQIRSPIQQ